MATGKTKKKGVKAKSKPKPKKRCGSPNTQSGNPCGKFSPCAYHDEKGKPTPKVSLKAKARQEKLLQGVMAGKDLKTAALDAGFSESTAEGKIYQIVNSPAYKARVQQAIADARLMTEEITGTAVGVMRMDIADLFPDDEFLQEAQRRGVSHNIKKIRRSPKFGTITAVECYSKMDAIKVLQKTFGLEQQAAPNQKAERDFNASVERVMQAAIDRGVTLRGAELRKAVEDRLRPAYELLQTSNANN